MNTKPEILLVITSCRAYKSGLPTGLWLSEITHIYHEAKNNGYTITIASPEGGRTPIDPESLTPLVLDKVTKKYLRSSEFQGLLQNTKTLEEISSQKFDCIYLAGGHGTMYDFPENKILQSIIRDHYENNALIAAICHGVGGLLHVKLSNNQYLITNKNLTGFSWFEETLARRKKEVPFNLEEALKIQGAHYQKAIIPMTSKVVVDNSLITGQNPFSSKEMAKVLIRELNGKLSITKKA